MVVLVIDDSEADLTLWGLQFRKILDVTPIMSSSINEAKKVLKKRKVDLVLTDHLMGNSTSSDCINMVQSVDPSIPVLIVSDMNNAKEGILNKSECMKKISRFYKLIKRYVGRK